MDTLGLPALLGPPCRSRDLAMALIITRVLHPATKLATLSRWSDTTLGGDLGVSDASTDEVYAAMDWLLSRQDAIEAKLAARHSHLIPAPKRTKFLAKIDAEVPAHLQVHLVCDNYGTHQTPAINKWLDAHPRFHMHHTPTYSSWLNQVERLFAYLTDDLLRRSDHRSVQALEKDIRNWVQAWNENPKPFVWTKTAEQILESLGRLMARISGAGY
jgi:transposase